MTTSSKVVPQSLSHIISFVSFIVVITLKLSSFFMFVYLFMYLSATQGPPALQKGLTLSCYSFIPSTQNKAQHTLALHKYLWTKYHGMNSFYFCASGSLSVTMTFASQWEENTGMSTKKDGQVCQHCQCYLHRLGKFQKAWQKSRWAN